ncbi:DUF4326 domain-containing protein [Herbiconiux solani]|uniref:DUF4326 domain-containing protein n=1 Tax=Herbiconiux solani TaxID=661329 RepID=UPI001FDFC2BD|nr:DUF4326 domain-containing protein [Herbiconiux solani]
MSRQRPWRADNPDAVIVARPSKWGNPFVVGHGADDREQAVQFFANWLSNSLRDGRYADGRTDYLGAEAADRPSVETIRAELAGRDLACWCPVPAEGEPDHCHGAVLLRIANR